MFYLRLAYLAPKRCTLQPPDVPYLRLALASFVQDEGLRALPDGGTDGDLYR